MNETEMPEPDDYWLVQRSSLDDRVWVPVPMGFGEQAHMLNAGGLRAVREYVEGFGPVEWVKVDPDTWKGVTP